MHRLEVADRPALVPGLPPLSAAAKTGAVLAFVAACVGAVFAWLPYEVFCELDAVEGNQCDTRHGELVWTLVLGIAGLVAAAAMLVAAYLDRGRIALGLFVLALVLYLASFWLSDAAVHGWDDLKYFPSL